MCEDCAPGSRCPLSGSLDRVISRASYRFQNEKKPVVFRRCSTVRREPQRLDTHAGGQTRFRDRDPRTDPAKPATERAIFVLSLIHISEPTRLLSISYAV